MVNYPGHPSITQDIHRLDRSGDDEISSLFITKDARTRTSRTDGCPDEQRGTVPGVFAEAGVRGEDDAARVSTGFQTRLQCTIGMAPRSPGPLPGTRGSAKTLDVIVNPLRIARH